MPLRLGMGKYIFKCMFLPDCKCLKHFKDCIHFVKKFVYTFYIYTACSQSSKWKKFWFKFLYAILQCVQKSKILRKASKRHSSEPYSEPSETSKMELGSQHAFVHDIFWGIVGWFEKNLGSVFLPIEFNF